MPEQIACHFCGTHHKARSDKFPLKLLGKKKEIVGYVCSKCKSKYDRLKKKEGLSR